MVNGCSMGTVASARRGKFARQAEECWEQVEGGRVERVPHESVGLGGSWVRLWLVCSER